MTGELEFAADDDELEGPRSRLTVVLVVVLAVAVLAIAGTVGWLIGNDNSNDSAAPSVSVTSVDAGFARDMSTHHQQAVTMAGYERDTTTNPSLKLLSFDIETSQAAQLGEMQGWLDSWGLTRTANVPVMAWMAGHDHVGADGLMPGMATPAQVNTLESLTGKPMDILFLQLMIHHHQGGLPMEQFAAQHASMPYVRNLAVKMVQLQTSEIVQMNQLLTQLGGSPLAPPTQ